SNLSKFRFMDFCYWLEISYGNLFFKLKDYKNALFHHKKSLLYSEKFQDRRTINSFKLISEDYEALSNFKESLIYLKKFNNIIEKYDKIKNHDLFIRLFEDYENSKSYHSVKNNFFSNLSHELKTPVNIIYSYVQLMSSLKDKDSYYIEDCFFKYERSIKQNCLRMLKLINNLIDITKIDSGSVQLNTSPLDVVPFIENLTLSVIQYTKYKNLNIIFDTNIENLYMKLDPYALERILLNLLSNSIKFTRTNGNILVRLEKTNFDFKIIVRDDGIGIPDNLKDLVFNRFFKVDTTLSRNTEGSGIGLSITKGLVEMQGGYIYLNKDYTEGCEFIITFSNMLEVNDSIDVDFKHFIDDEKILRELSDIYELF
ncbi:MAG: HAMP domain-containing sensor histidine kinase, partial [Bacilli bacterium]